MLARWDKRGECRLAFVLIITFTTNAPLAAKKLEAINVYIASHQIEFFTEASQALYENVVHRIATQDGGTWPELSKWGRAKKGINIALKGAEKFVKWKADAQHGVVYDETGEEWTLTQHHHGFANKPEAGRIEIDVIDPGPLGLTSLPDGKFSWIAKRSGDTPARKIWPADREEVEIVLPIASRWLEKVVREALASG